MSRHDIVLPEGLPPPSGFSHGVVAAPGDRLLHVAGQIAVGEEDSIVAGGFVDQFDLALGNVVSVVAAAGGSADDIVSMTVYTTDMDSYRRATARLGDTWRRHMGRHYPAMALIGVASLVDPAAVVEISAVASIPAGDGT